MTNAERETKSLVMVETGRVWLARHIKAANHGGKVDVTCPMCIRIVTASHVVVMAQDNG